MKIFLIAGMLFGLLEAKSLFTNDEQEQRSKYIGALKDLIIYTQKTRGLTNSYLNGNTVAQLLVYDNRQKMKGAIGDMESLPFAADPVINKRATQISLELMALNRKAFKKESAMVFESYTGLISQTMMLAQSVGKRGADKLNPLGREFVVVMMEIMLPLTEYVGQLRGLGSGIAAKGTVNKIKKEELIEILSHMDYLSRKLQSEMSMLTGKYNDKFDSSIELKVHKTMTLINNYMEFAKTNFLKPDFKVDPDAYFDDGTEIITNIINVYNVNNDIIKKDSEGWL